jgi:hypothetical protein
MKKLGLVFAVALLALSGCASTALYQEKSLTSQSIEGDTTFNVMPFYDSTGITATADEWPQMVANIDVQKNTGMFGMDFTVWLKNWLFLDGLKVSADGKVFSLKTGTPRRDIGNGEVKEFQSGVLMPDAVAALKTAKEIKIQWAGSKGNILHTLKPEAVKAINDFITRHMAANQAG